MPKIFSHFKSLFIATLETALNRYISIDPDVAFLITPIAGKVIALEISSVNETIYLCPGTDRIQILENHYGSVDATLKGSIAALGLMGISATPAHSLFKGKVRIEGDTAVAQKLQNLFAKLDMNPESKISEYTGSTFAKGLSNLFRSGRQWSDHSLNTFRLNLQEFLQEETRDLPAKTEAEIFFQQTDICRGDYDRLKTRIERLEAAHAKMTEQQQNLTGIRP
jgi:ubiquinone biosynthesis protein UbiJ